MQKHLYILFCNNSHNQPREATSTKYPPPRSAHTTRPSSPGSQCRSQEPSTYATGLPGCSARKQDHSPQARTKPRHPPPKNNTPPQHNHRLRSLPMPMNRQHRTRLNSIQHPLRRISGRIAQIHIHAKPRTLLRLSCQLIE